MKNYEKINGEQVREELVNKQMRVKNFYDEDFRKK